MSATSGVQGKVGPFALHWKSVPRGTSGTSQVDVGGGKSIEVRWRRDADGVWVELPHGIFGFDITASTDDDGRTVYQVSQRGAAASWSSLAFVRAGEESAAAGAASGPKKGMRIRAQMPGKIISVSVKTGDTVEKDQPLLVMEAMKMENVIRAPQSGKVGPVKVGAGQTVETGADLCVIDPAGL